MRTVFDLMQAVACKLVGKPVILRLQIPAVVGADGACHMDENGVHVLDIKSDVGDERKLFVLCHECAHAKLHKHNKTDIHKRMPRTIPMVNKDYFYHKHESEADTLANHWCKYARAVGGDDFENQLWALYRMDGEK